MVRFALYLVAILIILSVISTLTPNQVLAQTACQSISGCTKFGDLTKIKEYNLDADGNPECEDNRQLYSCAGTTCFQDSTTCTDVQYICNNGAGNTPNDGYTCTNYCNNLAIPANCGNYGASDPRPTCSAYIQTCLDKYCKPAGGGTNYTCPSPQECISPPDPKAHQCITPVATPVPLLPPEPDLKINNSNGPVILSNNSYIYLSWKVKGGTPDNCYLTSGGQSLGNVPTNQDYPPGKEQGPLVNQSTRRTPYIYTLTCTNTAAPNGVSDQVDVYVAPSLVCSSFSCSACNSCDTCTAQASCGWNGTTSKCETNPSQQCPTAAGVRYTSWYSTIGSCNSCAGNACNTDPASCSPQAAIWIPPSCNNNTFSGCKQAGGNDCSDWGNSEYPNFTSNLWNQCRQACTSTGNAGVVNAGVVNPDYCAPALPPNNTVRYNLSCSVVGNRTFVRITGGSCTGCSNKGEDLTDGQPAWNKSSLSNPDTSQVTPGHTILSTIGSAEVGRITCNLPVSNQYECLFCTAKGGVAGTWVHRGERNCDSYVCPNYSTRCDGRTTVDPKNFQSVFFSDTSPQERGRECRRPAPAANCTGSCNPSPGSSSLYVNFIKEDGSPITMSEVYWWPYSGFNVCSSNYRYPPGCSYSTCEACFVHGQSGTASSVIDWDTTVSLISWDKQWENIGYRNWTYKECLEHIYQNNDPSQGIIGCRRESSCKYHTTNPTIEYYPGGVSYKTDATDKSSWMNYLNPTLRDICVANDGAKVDYVFKERTYTISGNICDDYDNDGQRDCTTPGVCTEPGYPNLDVSLTGNGLAEQKIKTSSDGDYSFTNLKPGMYIVNVAQPARSRKVVPINPVIQTVDRDIKINFCISPIQAWLQTIGGDVHSNVRIHVPGGP